LDNLQDKVPGGRRLNVDNALSGRPGQILTLHPKEDFDASGYSDTPETRLHLYTQSGAVVQAAAGATHTLILKEDQIPSRLCCGRKRVQVHKTGERAKQNGICAHEQPRKNDVQRELYCLYPGRTLLGILSGIQSELQRGAVRAEN
jgi:hypothetical protein